MLLNAIGAVVLIVPLYWILQEHYYEGRSFNSGTYAAPDHIGVRYLWKLC